MMKQSNRIAAALLAIVIALSGSTASAQPKTYPESDFLKNLPDIVATVEGTPIAAETYRKAVRLAAFRQAQDDIGPDGEVPALSEEQEIRVLRLLVETQAMSILAQASGIEVSDDDLKRAIAIDAQRAGGPKGLEERLKQTGTDMDAYASMRRAQLTQRLYAQTQVRDVSVSEEEVRAAYKTLREAGELEVPERASVRHILILAADTTESAWQAAKEGIATARKRIVEDDEDFGLVASELSDEKATAANGGKVMLPRNGSDNDFQNLAFSLELGEVSEPFKSKVGWHILMVERRIPAGHLAYDEVQKRIHDRIMARRRVEALRKHVLTAMKSMDIKYNVDLPEGVGVDDVESDVMEDQEAIESLLQDAS